MLSPRLLRYFSRFNWIKCEQPGRLTACRDTIFKLLVASTTETSVIANEINTKRYSDMPIISEKFAGYSCDRHYNQIPT